MRKYLQVLAVSSAIFAATAPAKATVITFDQGLDMSGAPFAPLLAHTDYLIQDGYVVGMYGGVGAAWPDLVGALVDGSDVANTCGGMGCPTNNNTQFLAGLNDGLPEIFREDGGGFRLEQFDMSFVAAAGVAVPPVSLYMRLIGFDEFGDFLLLEDFLVPGPAAGAYSFSTYDLSDAFAATELHYLDFVGYACDANGDCWRGLNLTQFGLDNLTFADAVTVPEPTSLALAGLALAGLATARRRSAIKA